MDAPDEDDDDTAARAPEAPASLGRLRLVAAVSALLVLGLGITRIVSFTETELEATAPRDAGLGGDAGAQVPDAGAGAPSARTLRTQSP
ncbi:MAG: hypothetical protein K1X94_23235 [Sandaracinaceae bacterium]|nr:hypothetical protein [Sandaracinaceae bacterium]